MVGGSGDLGVEPPVLRCALQATVRSRGRVKLHPIIDRVDQCVASFGICSRVVTMSCSI